MSYSNPNRVMYSMGTFDFGAAANETFSVYGPKGKASRLWDYGVYGVTEIFAGSGITAKVAVGSPSDPDAYGEELVLDGLADNSATSIRMLYGEYDTTNLATYLLDAGKAIAADSEIVLSCTASSGSPTGIAVPFVILDHDW